jgi:hypothetical protein
MSNCKGGDFYGGGLDEKKATFCRNVVFFSQMHKCPNPIMKIIIQINIYQMDMIWNNTYCQ